MDFENTRTNEMLDAAEASSDKHRKMIVAVATSMTLLQMEIVRFYGRKILTEEGREVRNAFSLCQKGIMTAICETSDDVKQYKNMTYAIFRDLADLRGK